MKAGGDGFVAAWSWMMGGRSRETRLRRLLRLNRQSERFPAFLVRYGRRYLVDFPDDHVAWMIVGGVLTDLARYEEAEQAIGKALDLFPPEKRQLPLAQMGHLFQEAGDYDQAASWYRRAVEADPIDASYRIYLGAVLAKQGRFAEAEDIHRSATECVGGCIDEAYLNLGFVLRARERFSEAAECFREAIQRTPDYRLAHRALRDVERCIKFQGGNK